ncbi:MAG: hypothetical protein EA384_01945 [Spirochaetaceae bacterium]|nr:MAG: hypothetical protein EA384_01945 [Spirochaetaceae bacterium]
MIIGRTRRGRRRDSSVENSAIRRHITLNLLKHEKSCKRSIARNLPARRADQRGQLVKVRAVMVARHCIFVLHSIAQSRE